MGRYEREVFCLFGDGECQCFLCSLTVRGFCCYEHVVLDSSTGLHDKNVVCAVRCQYHPLLSSGFLIHDRELIGLFTVLGKTADFHFFTEFDSVEVELRCVGERLLYSEREILSGGFAGSIFDKYSDFVVCCRFGRDFNLCIFFVALCGCPFFSAGLAFKAIGMLLTTASG